MPNPENEPASAEAFSELELEFFRAGDEAGEVMPAESLEPDDPPMLLGVWARMFRRAARLPTEEPPMIVAPAPTTARVRAATEPGRVRAASDPRVRAASEPAISDEEWDWTIAIARARFQTQPG